MIKKIIFTTVAIAIISCNSSKPVDYTLFSGTIKNANSKSLTILNSLGNVVREIKVSDTGMFADTIFNTNGYYIFKEGKESSALYLKDDYNIELKHMFAFKKGKRRGYIDDKGKVTISLKALNILS